MGNAGSSQKHNAGITTIRDGQDIKIQHPELEHLLSVRRFKPIDSLLVPLASTHFQEMTDPLLLIFSEANHKIARNQESLSASLGECTVKSKTLVIAASKRGKDLVLLSRKTRELSLMSQRLDSVCVDLHRVLIGVLGVSSMQRGSNQLPPLILPDSVLG